MERSLILFVVVYLSPIMGAYVLSGGCVKPGLVDLLVVRLC